MSVVQIYTFVNVFKMLSIPIRSSLFYSFIHYSFFQTTFQILVAVPESTERSARSTDLSPLYFY